jgi:hypothetical protein
MEASRRQLSVLGGVLAVLTAVLYWQATREVMSPAERAAAAQGSDGNRAAAPAASASPGRPAAATQIPVVAIAALDRPQPEPADSGRDPFHFGAAPAERNPAPGAGRAGTRGGSAVTPTGTATAQPAGPPPPPPILLKFIGIARQGTGRLYAVLRDDRGVYYGADGDVVEGRFKVLRVSADTVEVSYVDGRGRVSIPLSGGRP